MDNLEYLKGIKEGFDETLKEPEPLIKTKEYEEFKVEIRKMKALEIIAEELIGININMDKLNLKMRGMI